MFYQVEGNLHYPILFPIHQRMSNDTRRSTVERLVEIYHYIAGGGPKYSSCKCNICHVVLAKYVEPSETKDSMKINTLTGSTGIWAGLILRKAFLKRWDIYPFCYDCYEKFLRGHMPPPSRNYPRLALRTIPINFADVPFLVGIPTPRRRKK